MYGPFKDTEVIVKLFKYAHDGSQTEINIKIKGQAEAFN